MQTEVEDIFHTMSTYREELLHRIQLAKKKAVGFFSSLETEHGFKYTATHDVNRFPSALLYGTWATVLGQHLLQETSNWDNMEREWIMSKLKDHQRRDGMFLPKALLSERTFKSHEYLILHCTNYSQGALLELFPDYDFETPYLHRFLDGDTLQFWLDGRSFLRPWEEGNNIVNVAAYLALCDQNGVKQAEQRLLQLLEWHRKYQNPTTGGFDCFATPGQRHRQQSLAGAVHNFHLHLYLGESYGYEEVIASALPRYLFQGCLTACLSIDFVELAIRTLPYAQHPQYLVWALLYHAEALLASQQSDGGWLEADNNHTPSHQAGFQDSSVSSCSYATWFRLCSLGMISIVLLGDSPGNWNFRKTLGMGYAPLHWPELPSGVSVSKVPSQHRRTALLRSTTVKMRKTLVRVGTKLL